MQKYHPVRATLLGVMLAFVSYVGSDSLFAAELQQGSVGVGIDEARAVSSTLPNPILFVTQYPVPADFGAIGSVFANHRGDIQFTGRGGDLFVSAIRAGKEGS